MFFVWRETQKGPPRCEVWFGELTEGFKPVPTLAKRLLSDEEAWKFQHGAMSLGDLAALYPPPAMSDRNVFP